MPRRKSLEAILVCVCFPPDPDPIFINLLGTFRLQRNEHLQGRKGMQLNPPLLKAIWSNPSKVKLQVAHVPHFGRRRLQTNCGDFVGWCETLCGMLFERKMSKSVHNIICLYFGTSDQKQEIGYFKINLSFLAIEFLIKSKSTVHNSGKV